MIIYEGPSVLNGADIVVIATGIDTPTSNYKTGDMVQLWILLQAMAPHHAVATGDDVAICGHCPHRHGAGGQCYVMPWQAPLAVWQAYMAGSYPELDLTALEGRQIRFGAYGDPAAIPFEDIRPVLEVCDLDGSTGYSHQLQHKNWDPRVAMFCQISVDTPKQALAAHASGFKTFRLAGDAQKQLPGEIECLSDSAGLSCAQCQLCNGNEQSIVITAHGARSSSAKQHDVIRSTAL